MRARHDSTHYEIGDRVVSVTARNQIGSVGTVVEELQSLGEIRVHFDHVNKTFWVHTSDFRKLPKGSRR